jgi:hypothetical protein
MQAHLLRRHGPPRPGNSLQNLKSMTAQSTVVRISAYQVAVSPHRLAKAAQALAQVTGGHAGGAIVLTP